MSEIKLERRKLASPKPDLRALPDLVAQIYAARGVEKIEDVGYTLKHLASASTLSNINRVAHRLADAVIKQQKILMVGDYDADGATSTAVAIRGFKLLGTEQVSYLVPNRFEYGYGLTPELIAAAVKEGLSADLIITVDNGISNHAGVEAANATGADVIITDHHLPGKSLPAAYAIVNPNLADDAFPSKALAGVGVMFYVLVALRQELQEREWFAARDTALPKLADLLDLVALGTVADVVPLDQNNRILVEQGLRRIRSGKAAPGILEILKVAGKHNERVTATDLGFAAGPRLNAAGRLEDMALGIECLLTDDQARAQALAAQLDALNMERRDIESGMQQQAEKILQDNQDLTAENKLSLCLYDSEWHQGVIGIVAARLKEKVHRPVIVFADENDDHIKGSARSIPGLHIRDVLQRVDARHPDLIVKYGGHAMAAGLTLLPEDLDIFERAFEKAIKDTVNPQVFQQTILSDGILGDADLSLETGAAIRQAGPWGQQFPEPVFDGEFSVISSRLLKEKYFKLVLSPPDRPEMFLDAIAFRCDPAKLPSPNDTVKIAYKLDVNYFRGQESLQMMIEHIF